MPVSYPRTEKNRFDFSSMDSVRETNRRMNAMLRSLNIGYMIPHLSFEEKKKYLENVMVNFDELLGSSVDSDHAINRIEMILDSFKDGSLNLGILDPYRRILATSVDSDHAISRLGRLFRAGPLEAKIDYNEVLASSVDSDHAISRLEYLASEAKEGGGTLMLPLEIYTQILNSSIDSDHAIRRLGRLFRAGHIEAKIDYNDVLATSVDSDHAISRLEYLASEAKEGGGTLMLSSKTYRQILGSSVDSDHAINRLSRLLRAGPLEITINYNDILNSSVDSDQAVARLIHLSSSAREGIFMHIDETSKAVKDVMEDELLKQKEEQEEGKQEMKSLSEIAQESFQEVNRYFSKKRTSILMLSSKTYNQVLNSSVDSDHTVNRLGRILKSGHLGLSVIYNDILNSSVDSDHAISRLEYLASEAKEGGGFITLPSGTYNQILESSVDSDHAINRVGRLFRNGTVDLSFNYNDILSTSVDSDHAIGRLMGLGLQAKEGVLRPIKEKTEELEKKIEQELVEREDRKEGNDDDLRREKKSASKIAQESFQGVNKEFGKKHTSVLKLSPQTYRQILATSVDSDHAVSRLGMLLSSGPVRIPINYRDILDSSVDSDHAISRIEYLGKQTKAWKEEYDERLNTLYVNSFKLGSLREGYTLEEIQTTPKDKEEIIELEQT